MKYYIYISDTKVDMLLPQVPHEVKKKIATEFGFDWKILTAKRKVERETEQDRITRLETVVAFIREFGNIGSVDEPEDYVEDTLLMSHGSMEVYTGPPIICFGGKSNKTIVSLFGSSTHMIGGKETAELPQPFREPGSAMSAFVRYLTKADAVISMPGVGEDDVFSSIYRLTAAMRDPKQRLGFLAKRMLWQPNFRHGDLNQVLVATPLYVAMAE